MTEKLKQIIKEKTEKLPKENQDAINAFNWGKLSEDIGKKYLLNEGEINDLQIETFLVLVGLADPGLYQNNIENNVGTSKFEANKIAEEVFEKIFTPVNGALLEKIKESEKIKNSTAEQNLNFIFSGGDYSNFMDSARDENSDKFK